MKYPVGSVWEHRDEDTSLYMLGAIVITDVEYYTLVKIRGGDQPSFLGAVCVLASTPAEVVPGLKKVANSIESLIDHKPRCRKSRGRS